MGRALITSGGTDGRYAIQVDYGSAQRDALIAALNQLIEKYNTAIDGQDAAMVTLQAREAETKEQIRIASNGITPPGYVDEGAPLTDDLKRAIITIGRENLLRIQMALRPLQLNGDKMKYERADAIAKIATLTTATAIVNKDAWCTTFTEDGAGYVATIDINGESNLTLVAPEARAWTAADGMMTMPHVMSPAQSFFNTAILPGWQKHRPQYRWGTISGINYDENTASVNLAPATSSAQNLNINKFTSLSNIPVQYMTCDAEAFEVGDNCVVQFMPGALAGDLDAKVIGFLDNPKPCIDPPEIRVELTYSITSIPNALDFQFWGATHEVRVTGAAFAQPQEHLTIQYTPPSGIIETITYPAGDQLLYYNGRIYFEDPQTAAPPDTLRTEVDSYIPLSYSGGPISGINVWKLDTRTRTEQPLIAAIGAQNLHAKYKDKVIEYDYDRAEPMALNRPGKTYLVWKPKPRTP